MRSTQPLPTTHDHASGRCVEALVSAESRCWAPVGNSLRLGQRVRPFPYILRKVIQRGERPGDCLPGAFGVLSSAASGARVSACQDADRVAAASAQHSSSRHRTIRGATLASRARHGRGREFQKESALDDTCDRVTPRPRAVTEASWQLTHFSVRVADA